MLRKLSVKNFKLLRDVTIDVTPGKPIVLIGPNASGKSSVLQTLDLLSRWADEGFVKGCLAFGGASSLITARKSFSRIEIDTDVHEIDTDVHEGDGLACFEWLRYAIEFGQWIRNEELTARAGKATDVVTLSRKMSKAWLYNDRTATNDELSLSTETLSFEEFKQARLYPSLAELVITARALHIYDGFLTAPLWLRDPREGQLSPFDSSIVSPVTRIGRRGLDLVNALHHIQQNHGDAWDELMDAFRAEFPFVQRLEFPADPAGGRIALAFRDKRYPGERMQGHQMSEGMATYLCLLAAILAPEPAAALAFDEPDRHLHPSALRRIVHLLEKASERSAVFIATHSDRFLDYLSDPAGSIRICEPTPDGMKLRSLEADALDEWRTLYSISTLRERGQLDPVNSVEIDP